MANQLFARKPLHILLEEMKGEHRLKRVLGPVTLTSLGVGAIIGAGIFVSTGAIAKETSGPALMLSYVVAGTVCIFAALCYAEFASMVPVAGSAYTYAYATLGELMAWIIGWDLVLEYAVGAATVANGWSGYAQSVLKKLGVIVPEAFSGPLIKYDAGSYFMNTTATTNRVTETVVENGQEIQKVVDHVIPGSLFNLPAFVIVALVTIVLVVGIKESASFNATMVIIKLVAVLFVIGVGAFYVDTANWAPFAPFGYTGISFFGIPVAGETVAGRPVGAMAGAALAFFAYIGFDSVSTHSEEAKNPQRDVPIGIIASLIICTLLYIAVVAVLTGMVKYTDLDKNAPVADAFGKAGLGWAEFLIALGGVTGITSVLLVMMLSQPRVLLAMSRDGLLPPSFFGAIHDKFRTPWKSTILTGIFVSILAGFLPIDVLLELVNVGTLLAFVMVCAAVLIMRRTHPNAERPFRVPFYPIVPILGILTCGLLMFSLPAYNWIRLAVWLAIGLVIYFFYSRKHSHMVAYLAHEISKHGVSPGGQLVDDVKDKDEAHPDKHK